MKSFKIILTGATGMVGEGVLLHCLDSDEISEVLLVTRRKLERDHPKLKQLLLPDFNQAASVAAELSGYDACFYCAGISSVGMKEAEYTQITYDTTLNFARVLLQQHQNMVFNFVSGAHTNASGRQMWQRVKGRTENALLELGFAGQYNFRPGFMKPVAGQQNVRWFFKPLIAIFPLILPGQSLTLHQVAQAMINTLKYPGIPGILEIKDIRQLAAR